MPRGVVATTGGPGVTDSTVMLEVPAGPAGPVLAVRGARGHFGRDHFHRGRRFGFGGGYDDWCYEYPYYTANCYLYGY